ncbi:MAG: PAS domain S-box protein [Calditrichaeota bacterium]|nr:PAS domain S-box protein [Calditrichota bacterium]
MNRGRKTLENRTDRFDILNHSPIGMCVIDDAYNVVFWNRCISDWTNIQKENILGKKIQTIYPHFKQSKYKNSFNKIFGVGKPTNFPIQLHGYIFKEKSPNGKPRVQHTTVTAIPAENAGHYYALFAIEDVTEMTHRIKEYKRIRDLALCENKQRKKAEAKLHKSMIELEQTNQKLIEKNIELDQFNYIVSHDLQAPLRTISSFSKFLQKNSGNILSKKSLKYLGFIISASKRMHLLIENLLSLSKSTRTTLNTSEFAVDNCVDDALQSLQSNIDETKAKIDRQNLLKIKGDKILITQLYQNLIGNALKFVDHKEPQINLTVDYEGSTAVFGVLDNGIGISQEFKNSIFEPFKKADSDIKYEGSGLGLAICKKIIERHKGHIWVESNPGEGTHFKFTLGNIN